MSKNVPHGKDASLRADSCARIYAAISRIPRGRVATYGQIASVAGLPGRARLVGYALKTLAEESRVPWQRVINAGGRISTRSDESPMAEVQRVLLEREGVELDANGRITLDRFGWQPKEEMLSRTAHRRRPGALRSG
jgi:methylated-DNA-protein-cysteine methyltransferase related protein